MTGRSRAPAAAAAAAALAAVLAGAPARAQEDRDRYRSPQAWALELKLGPYRPDVDGSPGLSGEPYRETFGDDTIVIGQVELDRQWRIPLSTVGVGLTWGWFRDADKAFEEGCRDGCRRRSATDRTALAFHTFVLQAVVRLDGVWRRLHVPIVPYGKAGLDYYLWRIARGDGSDTAESGGAVGWQAAAGAAFPLDVLDRGAATRLDDGVGVNHTYLFAEVVRADVDNFDGKGLLGVLDRPVVQLGDTTWLAGLAFEF